MPSTEKNYKHSADDNDVNDDDDDDKEEEEERFFAHLAVRVLLREEDGHVGGDKASPAGDKYILWRVRHLSRSLFFMTMFLPSLLKMDLRSLLLC